MDAPGEHAHQKALGRIVATAPGGMTLTATLSPASAYGGSLIAIKGLVVGQLGRGNSASYAHVLANGPIEVPAHITSGPNGWLVDVALPERR